MNEEDKQKAMLILAKPSSSWSKADSAFLYGLIKRGQREALKALRVEALLV
jgi:hypothetical protein